jgi:hypothetical protein
MSEIKYKNTCYTIVKNVIPIIDLTFFLYIELNPYPVNNKKVFYSHKEIHLYVHLKHKYTF